MSVFGLHRFLVYGIRPFELVGVLQLNTHKDPASVFVAIQTLLCYPLGMSAAFCGWGRASCVLSLRNDDVSVNDSSMVVLVALEEVRGSLNDVIDAGLKLTAMNLAFDSRGIRSVFSVLDVSPRVCWFHVLQALELDVMFGDTSALSTQSGCPPVAVRAILVGLLCERLPERIPGVSVVDSPWLRWPAPVCSPADRICEMIPRRPFSTVSQVEVAHRAGLGTVIGEVNCDATAVDAPVSATLYYSQSVALVAFAGTRPS
jgi:hypothetical protein